MSEQKIKVLVIGGDADGRTVELPSAECETGLPKTKVIRGTTYHLKEIACRHRVFAFYVETPEVRSFDVLDRLIEGYLPL